MKILIRFSWALFKWKEYRWNVKLPANPYDESVILK
jgi:hypothetical protein